MNRITSYNVCYTKLLRLHTILDKAATLERIIDDLLDLSRIESGRGLSLSFSEWDVAETRNNFV